MKMQGFVYVSREQENIIKGKFYCAHTDMCHRCYKHSLSLPPCFFFFPLSLTIKKFPVGTGILKA